MTSEIQGETRGGIVFALDFPSAEDALRAATTVAPMVGMLKVGLELFIHAGPAAMRIGLETKRPVFLDLKLHDIPETVERAVAQASKHGARLLSVHASGGREMLRRAVERAKAEGGTLDICAITILTSLDDDDLDDVGIRVTRRLTPIHIDPNVLPPLPRPQTSFAAESLARLAFAEGVRHFVCSPAEVAPLRQALGSEAVLLTPGIRAGMTRRGDQKRVGSPQKAIRDGADWLVVGRPIRDAPDRLEAAREIANAIAGARTPE